MGTAGPKIPSELQPATQTIRSCLIIGGGVAGLQALRHIRGLGLQALLLEAANDIGGVWKENYVGYALQVPWRMYQFPDFLWPPELHPRHEYPTGQQVQAYIRAYAAHFGLMRHVRLNCKLLRLRWKPGSRAWEALYCDTERAGFFKVTADYVVMCSGMYCNPFVPLYKGSESFAGVQLHAKDFTDMSAARGRRVVIVGAGKTALDCVGGLLASRTAASVTLLYRQAHWPVPRSVAGLPVRRLLFSRAAAAMLPPYYTAARGERAAHLAARPLKKLFWLGIQGAIVAKFKATRKLNPSVSLPADLFYGGQILDDNLDELLKGGQTETLRGEINSFVRDGVVLQDGSFRPADLVLYCTGYEKSYSCFDSATRAQLGIQKDGLYLYRNCLPCNVPQLAFIGSEVSTYNNILTHSLQALWLAHVLTGAVQLPSPDAMAADVRAQQRWRREVMPAQRSRGAVLMMYGMQYHDQLLRDMGLNPRRKGTNPLAECFGTYSAEDYTGLSRRDAEVFTAARIAAERLTREHRRPPPPPPPSMAVALAPAPAAPPGTNTMAVTAAVTALTAPATAAGGGYVQQSLCDTLGLDDSCLTTGDWPYTEPLPDPGLRSCCDGGGTAAAAAATGVSSTGVHAVGRRPAGLKSAPSHVGHSSGCYSKDSWWRAAQLQPTAPWAAAAAAASRSSWPSPPEGPYVSHGCQSRRHHSTRSRGAPPVEPSCAPTHGSFALSRCSESAAPPPSPMAPRPPPSPPPPPPPPLLSPPSGGYPAAIMTTGGIRTGAGGISTAFAASAPITCLRQGKTVRYHWRASASPAARRGAAAGGVVHSRMTSLQHRESSGGTSRLSRVVFGPAAFDTALVGGGRGSARSEGDGSGGSSGNDGGGADDPADYIVVGLHDILHADDAKCAARGALAIWPPAAPPPPPPLNERTAAAAVSPLPSPSSPPPE